MNDESLDPSALSTGDPQVDEALSRLEHLDEADLDEHVAVFDDVQRALGDVLGGAASGEPQEQ